ncbi:MAG: rRNA maturation RNase YbeY [Verrucomicrobiota bacterium]|nr:rRNA maturation RNase YbeY [Verrucomicrobiota bacterium]
MSKRKICKLHEEFFQDPTLTDCISFPLDKEYLGDIFVCPAVAKEYVEKNGGEVYEEAMLYIVHALLHLLGYDDLDAQKRKVMRAKEKACMDHLRKSELLNL